MTTASAPPIEFLGLPGSPYSLKMLAYLRFRRLPYLYHCGPHEMLSTKGYPVPSPAFFPTFYLPDTQGNRAAVTDSTPIIRRLEQEHHARRTLPDDPAMRFLVDLVEDFADEWMTKLMFHFRWAIPENASFITQPLAYWLLPHLSAHEIAPIATAFAKRQIDRLRYVGSNKTTAPAIEASYLRILNMLDALIQKQGYVFGARPTAADFALYGQLSQLTRVDLTPTRLCQQHAPRVLAWVDRMADLGSADIPSWARLEDLSSNLRPLMEEIGRTYAPLAVANAKADATGETTVHCTIDGHAWVQDMFRYQVKCLNALRRSFADLSKTDQARVDMAVRGTGCEVFCHDAQRE
jgi:glutathione S-transferase